MHESMAIILEGYTRLRFVAPDISLNKNTLTLNNYEVPGYADY